MNLPIAPSVGWFSLVSRPAWERGGEPGYEARLVYEYFGGVTGQNVIHNIIPV